jgi:hypothetical protein
MGPLSSMGAITMICFALLTKTKNFDKTIGFPRLEKKLSILKIQTIARSLAYTDIKVRNISSCSMF